MEQIMISAFSASAPAWEQAIEALCPAAALQMRWGYGAVAASAGRAVRRVEICADGQRIGVAQVLGRGRFWLCNRGPVFAADLPEPLRRRALRRLARGLPGLLIATPEDPVAGFGLIPLLTARHHAIWDLTPEPEALRAGMRANWRNKLVRAERGKLRIGPDRDPRWLIAAETAQRAERRYRALPADFVSAWGQVVPDGVLALCARNAAGQKIAGAIFLHHGSTASYHLSWTGPEGRAAQAHTAILWQAALRLRAEGVRWLDLGEINSEAGASLMMFKTGTGARPKALGATGLVLPG